MGCWKEICFNSPQKNNIRPRSLSDPPNIPFFHPLHMRCDPEAISPLRHGLSADPKHPSEVSRTPPLAGLLGQDSLLSSPQEALRLHVELTKNHYNHNLEIIKPDYDLKYNFTVFKSIKGRALYWALYFPYLT